MADHDTHDHTGVTGVPDLSTHTGDTSDAHDASAISVLDTAANFTATDVEAALAELQDNIDAVSAGSGISYYSRRLWSQDPGNADATFNLNSSSYVAVGTLGFYHDWDFFPATHFLITGYGRSSESGQTVTAQLAPASDLTNPVSSGGNDLAITFNGGANTEFSSGWVAVSDSMSGLLLMRVALKGSNTTVDFTGRWLDIAFKID